TLQYKSYLYRSCLFVNFHSLSYSSLISIFFFNDPATPQIYTLSLHDALPISAIAREGQRGHESCAGKVTISHSVQRLPISCGSRSEEHTSELQSRENLVCRLLLEKKKKK